MTRDLSVASKVVEGHELGAGRIAESGSDLLGFVLLRGIFGGRGPRSVSEDAMEEDARNLNVLQLNGTEKVKSMDLSSKKLGPVSAAIIGACVRVNPVLESLKCAACPP